MANEIQNKNSFIPKLIEVSKVFTSVSIIVSGVLLLCSPLIDSYVDSRVEQYFESPEFKLEQKKILDDFIHSKEFSSIVDDVINDYGIISEDKLKLKSAIAEKLGVPEDEVHIKIGQMGRDIDDFKRIITEIIEEIYHYHDDSILVKP